jgi:outer membrane protein OmpA-like peptidoglycan-associated protein
MKKFHVAICMALALGVAGGSARAYELNAVLYPEGSKVPVTFETTDRAPIAKLQAAVSVERGQAFIDVEWSKLEPALLFGGDVNCWVMWVMTPDGMAVTLGELPVREARSGKARFAAPYKNFAMIVTAEPLPIVRKPSDLIGFVSKPSSDKRTKNSTFDFTAFRTTATARDQESIAKLKYTAKTPIDLEQARRAIALMDRYEAERYAEQQARDARVALGQADDAYAGRVGKKDDVPELSQRATALASEALRVAIKQIEEQQVKDKEAQRLAEMAALEEKRKTEVAAASAQTEQERLARMQVEAALIDVEKQRQTLEVDKTRLETERAVLKRERDALAARLRGALQAVSGTQRTGRGLVVSLSGGVLFDTGKSALKEDAKVMLAKLAGVLLMIPDTKIAIEGHTDSTGSAEINDKLSRARADSVMAFLESQGVTAARMTPAGLGPSQPVATNDTSEGRAQNRRVEIVVPEDGQQAQAR